MDELEKRNYAIGKMSENGKVCSIIAKTCREGRAPTAVPTLATHPPHPERRRIKGDRVALQFHGGRGLMKRFESGAALAMDMGLDPKVPAEMCSKYNVRFRTKKDPLGKKVSSFHFPSLSCVVFVL